MVNQTWSKQVQPPSKTPRIVALALGLGLFGAAFNGLALAQSEDTAPEPFCGPEWIAVPGQQLPTDKIRDLQQTTQDAMPPLRAHAPSDNSETQAMIPGQTRDLQPDLDTTAHLGPGNRPNTSPMTAVSDLYPPDPEPPVLANPSASHNTDSSPPASAAQLADGVKAYRLGDYLKAQDIVMRLTQQQPSAVNGWYYLALCHTQLGELDAARTAYNTVVAQAPKSSAARLARQGLEQLDRLVDADLDPPPMAAGKPAPVHAYTSTHSAVIPALPQVSTNPQYQTPQATAQAAAPAAVSSDMAELQQLREEMAALEAMGGSNNNHQNNNNGNMGNMGNMGWMMPMMAEMQQSGMANGKANTAGRKTMLTPEMMQSMMMQQMMQGFDVGGSSKHDD
jgi:hypothetical protein